MRRGGNVRRVVFFSKQKTAYAMLRSLVGSGMWIRKRNNGNSMGTMGTQWEQWELNGNNGNNGNSMGTMGTQWELNGCIVYTSYDADE